MTLHDFIENYDFEGSIVLLEGKREVADADKQKLFQLGALLASLTKNMIFRSGNADGSDLYFSEGVASVTNKRLQVITPYSGHRQSANLAYHTIPLDTINLSSDSQIVTQSLENKKTKKLVEQYVAGTVNSYTIKAAYIIRDTVKVLGTETIKPASFAIFYDNLLDPMTGGTGHTMNVCLQNDVPYINQTIWMKWLKKN